MISRRPRNLWISLGLCLAAAALCGFVVAGAGSGPIARRVRWWVADVKWRLRSPGPATTRRVYPREGLTISEKAGSPWTLITVNRDGHKYSEVCDEWFGAVPAPPSRPITDPEACFEKLGYRLVAERVSVVPATNRRRASRAFHWQLQGRLPSSAAIDVLCWKDVPHVRAADSAILIAQELPGYCHERGSLLVEQVGTADVALYGSGESKESLETLWQGIKSRISASGEGLDP